MFIRAHKKNIVELLIIYFLLYLKSELAFTEKIKYVIIIILQNKKKSSDFNKFTNSSKIILKFNKKRHNYIIIALKLNVFDNFLLNFCIFTYCFLIEFLCLIFKLFFIFINVFKIEKIAKFFFFD